jgi:hypothetical protein
MGETAEPETDTRPGSSRPVLSSWKEIARHFQIDVRTCQRWEKSFGLPVHRMDHSSRSRVIAYPDELERWHSQIYKAKSGETAVPEAAAAEIRDPRPKRRKRIVFLIAPAAFLLVLGALIGLDRAPDGFDIRGSVLVIKNKFGLRLWTYETALPDLEPASYYRDYFQEKKYVGTPQGDTAYFPMLIIRDLDGDGKKEVLFAPQTTGDRGGGMLLLINSRGRPIWEFQTGQNIRIGAREYPGNFVINVLDVRDFNGDGRPEILLVSHCYGESPSRILLLDLRKNVLGEYWHCGQLADMTAGPAGSDGRFGIVLVGQNNEYGCPILLVLDPLDMGGCSPQSTAWEFAGLPEGRERFYLRFPNNALDLSRSPRGSFMTIRTQVNGHCLLETPAGLRIDIDPAFQSAQFIPTDIFLVAYAAAYREHRLDAPFDARAFAVSGPGAILYREGPNWVPRPALSHPIPAAPSPLRQPH